MGSLTVACVYKPGGGFTNDYVYKLRDAVSEYFPSADRFVCLTDQRLPGIERIPFERNLTGWWNKLELFRKGLFSRQVVYLDLDTMLARRVTMFDTPRVFASLTSWKRRHCLASAVMTWMASDELEPIYKEFKPQLAYLYKRSMDRWGDQAWIQEHLPMPFEDLNDLYPGRIVSYKYHVCEAQAVPTEAQIVAFHGTPRPHEINWELPLGIHRDTVEDHTHQQGADPAW